MENLAVSEMENVNRASTEAEVSRGGRRALHCDMIRQ